MIQVVVQSEKALVVVDMVEGLVVAGVEVEVLILHFVEVVEEEVDLVKKTN